MISLQIDNKPNFATFLVFVGAAASFTATISSFETVAKREAILNPVPKQWEPIRTRENFYPLPDLVKTKTFDFSNKVFIFKIYLLIS